MSEVEQLFKALAVGLKAFAKGIEAAAEQLDGSSTDPLTAADTSPGKKDLYAKSSSPDRPEEKVRRASDSENIFKIIERQAVGVGIPALEGETGYSRRKIYNIVYRLKKEGRIKTGKKGIYQKV